MCTLHFTCKFCVNYKRIRSPLVFAEITRHKVVKNAVLRHPGVLCSLNFEYTLTLTYYLCGRAHYYLIPRWKECSAARTRTENSRKQEKLERPRTIVERMNHRHEVGRFCWLLVSRVVQKKKPHE